MTDSLDARRLRTQSAREIQRDWDELLDKLRQRREREQQRKTRKEQAK